MIMKPIILFIVLGFSVVIHAQKKFEYGFKGQLSDAIGLHPEKPFVFQNTARFIPELSLGYAFTEKFKIDTEISLNAYYTAENANKTWTDTAALPLYRAWLRLTGKQYEFRVGLQKINFGSAQLLRPLMWFDSVDPRDPQKITGGVYGALIRYYFKNNATIWFWTLAGNEKTKGLEFFLSI